MNEESYILSEEQAIDAYDDLMVRIAISSYTKIHGQQITEENERLKQDPKYQLTPQTEKRLRRTIERASMRKRIARISKSVYRAANKVAMIVLVLVTVFGSSMIASAEFRRSIYKLIFSHEERYTLIELDNRTNMEFAESDVYTWDHAFAPTLIPQGYEVTEVVNISGINRVLYRNDEGQYIKFTQTSNDFSGTMRVDTENAQLVQSVLINDSEGMRVEKDGIHTVIWRVGNSVLLIETNSNEDMIVSVAKAIRLLD